MKCIVENLAVEYSDQGEGAVIVMLHGWGDTSHTFDGSVRELPGFRIVRLDLPGFGGSERPKQTWGVGEYASFVQNFLTKLQIDSYTLVGHSFGGRIAIKGVGTAVLTPQKLFLIDSAGVVHPSTMRRHLLRFAAKIGKTLTAIWPLSIWRQKLRKRLYTKIGSDYFTAGSMSDVYLKVIGEDLLQYAKNIRIPTLLIWGKEDTATPLQDAQKIHEAIEGSQLKTIDDATHFVHQEHPQEVARFIKEFV